MDYNDVIKAMSNDQLEALKTENPDNASLITLVDGILEARASEAQQAQANSEFARGIEKLVSKLVHPEAIHNVYLSWQTVKVEQGEAEMTDVPQPDGTTITEARVPTMDVEQWVVEVNRATRVGSGGSATPAVSKRSITIFKHNPDGADENKGEFTSFQKFADSEKIVVGGDSARRAVERGGFYGVPLS